MIDEGYIKFSIKWSKGSPPQHPDLDHLNTIRTKLHKLGLIGVYDNGIGYGNLSIRSEKPEAFIISGTATGAKEV